MRFRTLICALGFLAVTAGGAAADDTSGEAGFQRCAACHLPGGEGIPGAFPPLKGRIANIAASQEGRAYLVGVVQAGLMGAITVDDIPYMGVMPAQGASYDASGISEVLNYAIQVLDGDNAKPDWAPFSAEEVAGLIKANSVPTSQGSAMRRQALHEQYPELR